MNDIIGGRKTLCTITVTTQDEVNKALDARNILGATWNEVFFKGVEAILAQRKIVGTVTRGTVDMNQ